MGEEIHNNKIQDDTIHLLCECESGTKMGVSSIDEVLEKINEGQLKQLLSESKEHHEKLKQEIHDELSKYKIADQEPNPIAKGMSWFKTNIKLTMDESDQTVADLITDGCDMGIKSLHRYMNQYNSAENTAKLICRKLIDIEEVLRKDLQKYL